MSIFFWCGHLGGIGHDVWLTFKDFKQHIFKWVVELKLFLKMTKLLVTWVISCFFKIFYGGSHKRSHSLGDKEIRRSPPSPAPEQPFRDRSNTLSEKPALPVIRDKYKDLTGEVEVRGYNCTADDFITCFKGFQSRLWLLLILSTVAGEWALRVRVAKMSGKRSGGLWVLFESLHNGMFCPLPFVQIDYSTLYTQSHGFKNIS